ncbi:MAG: YcjF family protein [Ectothiorhodospira sp.]
MPPAPSWRRLLDAVTGAAPAPGLDERIREQARAEAPVLWLLGKVQSGKSSIVRAVTGDAEVAIGNAFTPCTRTSRLYEFPPEAPVVRFLDTRGLEEADYDPAGDLALLEGRAHAVVAVARAMDPHQEAVLEVLRAVRQRHPHWPVVLVQTRLHDGYPDGRDHPDAATLAGDPDLADLRRALEAQARTFRALPGDGPVHMAAVDLTPPEEGFSDPEYGLEGLLDALDAGCADGREGWIRDLATEARAGRAARLRPHILGYALAAGAADVFPMVGAVAVPTVQGRMLHTIAGFHAVPWDRSLLRAFAASLGTGALLGIGAGFAARQVGKLVPGYGQVVGATAAGVASASVTYALGQAASYYLETRRRGVEDPQGVRAAYRGALREAHDLFRRRGPDTGTARPGDRIP